MRIFVFYSPILPEMTSALQERKMFVVECKRCRWEVPAGVKQFPFQPIAVSCVLCGERRRSLPSEVLLGRGKLSAGETGADAGALKVAVSQS